MKISSVSAFAALLASVVAVPEPAGHHFKAPGKGDVRGPCPGLNSLANHGFLPRSGKGNNLANLIKGGKEGLNMGIDFMSAIGLVGFQSAGPLATSFDLNQLDMHDFPIEHDASLSRQDRFFGQDHNLVPREYNMFMAPYAGMEQTNIKTASLTKWGRVNDSLTRNPDVAYGPRELILSYGETALYLQTMGRSTTSGTAELKYVQSLFQEERLPYLLGWTPSPQEITLPSLGLMTVRLQAANPNAAEEAIFVLTKGSLADLLEGKLILNSTIGGL